MLLSISKNCWYWLFWLRDFFFPLSWFTNPDFPLCIIKWVSVVNPRGVKLPNWQQSRLPLLVRRKYILKESLIQLSSFLLSIKLHQKNFSTRHSEKNYLFCDATCLSKKHTWKSEPYLQIIHGLLQLISNHL